jgi:hypothetical protein
MVVYPRRILHHWNSSWAEMECIVFASCLEKEALGDDFSNRQDPEKILQKSN